MIQSKFFDLYLFEPCIGKDVTTANWYKKCIEVWRVSSAKQRILTDLELGWVRGNVKRCNLIAQINVVHKSSTFHIFIIDEYECFLNEKTLTNQVRTFTRTGMNNVL